MAHVSILACLEAHGSLWRWVKGSITQKYLEHVLFYTRKNLKSYSVGLPKPHRLRTAHELPSKHGKTKELEKRRLKRLDKELEVWGCRVKGFRVVPLGLYPWDLLKNYQHRLLISFVKP